MSVDSAFLLESSHHYSVVPVLPHAAHDERMKLAICLGGNLLGSNPDSDYATEALGRTSLVAYLSTTLNTGHAFGLGKNTLILPVLARDEEPQPTTQESMFNYVRLSDGGPRRHHGPESEVKVIATIASRILGSAQPIDFDAMQQTANIRPDRIR